MNPLTAYQQCTSKCRKYEKFEWIIYEELFNADSVEFSCKIFSEELRHYDVFYNCHIFVEEISQGH